MIERNWISRLGDDIDERFSDLPVILSGLISGLCDSAAFTATSVFVSMQTGNTIFMALGASFLPYDDPHLWLRALVSISSFWLGCLCFSMTRYLRPRSKITLAASFFIQSILIFISAALAQSGAVPAFAVTSLGSSKDSYTKITREHDEITLLPIAFLAFQFGGQIVASRTLKFNEVPTNVLTSLYCDLLSDPNILAPLNANPKRNRRLAAVIFHVAGVIISGWLQRSRGGMASVLWLSAGLKMIMCIAWIFWKNGSARLTDKADS